MLDSAISFVDGLTKRPFAQRVLRAIVMRAERLANSNPKLYDGLMLCYALMGVCLLIGFLTLPLLIILIILINDYQCQFASSGLESYQIDKYALRSFQNWHTHLRLGWLFATITTFMIAMLFVVTRFRLRAPFTGILLLRQEAPALFEAIDEVEQRCQSKIDKVFVTDNFNCAVSASPKLNGEAHYLYLGYPCLASLSIPQFKAILAHELAHVSLRHSAAQNWWQQQRLTWFTLMDSWRKRQPYLYIPFNLLLFWYTPIFGALSFVRAKHQEFEADEGARAITSQDLYAKALLSFTIKKNLFEKAFSDQLGALLLDTKGDDNSLFEKAVSICMAASQDEITEIWKLYCQGIDEQISATHPCLVRRLQRLGLVPDKEAEKWAPDWRAILENETARSLTLLGDTASRIAERMGRAFSQKRMSYDVARDHAHFVRGNAHYSAKRLHEAVVDFDEAIRLNPYFVEAYVSRASALIKQGLAHRAILDCDKAIFLSPGHVLAFTIRTIANSKLGNWNDAIKEASAIIDLSPDSWQAYSLRGKAYVQLNKKAEAINDFSKVIELNSGDAGFYLERANLYLEAKELEKALSDVQSYLSIKPNELHALVMYGCLLRQLKRSDEALVNLDKLIGTNQKCGDVLVVRALLREEANDLDGARSDFEKSLALPLDSNLAFKLRTYVACRLNEWHQAVADGDTCLKSGQKDAYLLANHAKALQLLGRNEEALSEVSQAIAMEVHPRFLATRARAYHALNRNDEALADISKAIKLAPEGQFFVVRAEIYRALGKTNEAEEDEKRAGEPKVQAPMS
jgi:tetratricopeptide (TPR) repeat protein